jgi:hypothetical protein
MAQQMMVTIPAGVAPGQTFPVQTPDGRMIQVPLPSGVAPGQQVAIDIPQPVVVQAATVLQATPVVEQYQNPQPTAVVMPMAAPTQASMSRYAVLQNHKQVMVAQTRKGCIQELMGCEAKNEFYIHPQDTSNPPFLYSLEESSFLCRLCCKNQRPFKQTITMGGNPGGEVLMSMDRPFRLSQGPCNLNQYCCNDTVCGNPVISFNGGDASKLGKAEIPMYCCYPNIAVTNEAGGHEYDVHMPLCCGDMCVNCCAEGLCNCKIPFYVYKPGDTENQVGKIIKLWRGMGTELLSDADTFQVTYPEDATPEQRARLLGTTIFINVLFFETPNE